MSNFLLEIYSEEIPARMQLNAARAFKEYSFEILAKKNLTLCKDQITTFVAPKRIILMIEGFPATQTSPEKKIIGPKVGANERAVQGFLKSNNLTDIEQLEKIDHNKSQYFCYFQKESQASTKEIISGSIEKIIGKMTNSWPKLMSYASQKNGKTYKWIRPVRNILCLFDNKIVDLELFGLKAIDSTYGHFLNFGGLVKVSSIEKYQETLLKNFVIVDQDKRKKEIQDQIEVALKDKGLTTIDGYNSEIFNELNGICEFPTVLIGQINKKFMSLPPEILTLTLKSNQKFLCLQDKNNKLSKNFIFVCDAVCSKDKFESIINDNQKVAYARLQDATFYIEEDLKKSFDDYYEELKDLTFHGKLGSVQEKTKRIESLAEFLSLWIAHCPINLIKDTAKFCKADLLMKTVAEFTSLQGNIGAYCAKEKGYDARICDAIGEHYLPVGNNSDFPQTPVGTAISIADKTDNIVGLFLANQRPTSSKDPFALRRNAIAVLRTCIHHDIKIPFRALVNKSLNLYKPKIIKTLLNESPKDSKNSIKRKALIEDIVIFFIEKLKNILKEDYNCNADIINNIIDEYIENSENHRYCDVINLTNRVIYANKLVNDPENKSLIEAYKRSVNVLVIEEKKDGVTYNSKPHLLLLKQKEERKLYKVVKKITPTFRKLVKNGDFENAFKQLKLIQEPLKDFFDSTMVNDTNEKLRNNRLLILSSIRSLFAMVANFSKVEIKS